MTLRSCPSLADLERAFFTGDEAVHAHVEGCASCTKASAEIDDLAVLAQQLVVPPSSPSKRESLRTALTSRASAGEGTSTRWSFALAAGVVAVAAAGALLQVDMEPPRRGATISHRAHLSVLEPASRYWLAGAQPDEVVRLVEGALSVDVDRLESGERFRVVVGNAEVEVRGTSFDVVAIRDRLEHVRVEHGVVEVRVDGRVAAELRDGQEWTAAPAKLSEPSISRAPQLPSEAPKRTPARPAKSNKQAQPAAKSSPITMSEPVRSPRVRPGRQGFERGWSALKEGSYGPAIESFGAALEVAEDAAIREDARFFLGVAQARAQRLVAARSTLEIFIQAHPDSPRVGEAAVMAGWIAFDAGAHADAERLFTVAITSPVERARTKARKGLEALRRIRAQPQVKQR